MGDDNCCIQVWGCSGQKTCPFYDIWEVVKFHDVSEALSCPLGGEGWA